MMFDSRKIFDLRKIFAVPKNFLKLKNYCIHIIYYISYIQYITLYQLQIVRSSKRMKFLIIFVAFFGLALGSDLFVGSWKEDQYKREGLGDYIYERGM